MALNGSSYSDDYSEPKPPPKRDGFTLDLVLLGTLAVVLVFLLVPGARIRLMRVFTAGTPHKIATEATVWANKEAGYYYCFGSRFYGHGHGSFMKQGDALTLGYQPELGKYCAGSQKSDSKDVDAGKSHVTHPADASPVSRTSHDGAVPAERR